ncbi:hypothetical protein [Fimbriiglobus ruber]|uniref:Uncharacterized protein n=1 Tax=Fimbriiglobus ruber TaxID=1908690 RepID=A0A225DW15_9BACT|nr:hypothetical protein [Fimbriiglobus ruber]OWK45233.1 hypothetical protein FRUB_01564 [Fimbriiglobus ruber]
MRTWIWGGVLAAATTGGVYFVSAGAGQPSHCGPCVSAAAKPAACPVPAESEVVEVVDVAATLANPPAKLPQLPFVSFDEPPLAKPWAANGVAQAGFTELVVDNPTTTETAPRPRVAGAEPGSIQLASPSDPF